MPINHGIWKIGKNVVQVQEVQMDSEEELEIIVESNPEILNENWLIIGRQVLTSFNKYIDLLAIDNSGSVIIIELKKHKTPREVVAQGLDYASWVKSLSPSDLSEIFKKYDNKYSKLGKSLDQAFYDKFKYKIEEENVNSSHQIVIVAAELDSSTERIVKYLSDSDIPINAVFFKVFEDNNQKYLSRAWMIDPFETSEIATVSYNGGPWNGEFYVSFGHGSERNWEDAIKYGFISAGGGQWYSRTLNQLSTGDRIWVNIPKTGYVGVGTVSETAKKADEVLFDTDSGQKNIYDLPHKAHYHSQFKDDEDKAEYIVKVNWVKTVPLNKAISELGFFGNQNSVCKPTAKKWENTINRLKEYWHIK